MLAYLLGKGAEGNPLLRAANVRRSSGPGPSAETPPGTRSGPERAAPYTSADDLTTSDVTWLSSPARAARRFIVPMTFFSYSLGSATKAELTTSPACTTVSTCVALTRRARIE